ncbi:MAG: ZIP family metal transporter [Bacteroidota bacterium]
MTTKDRFSKFKIALLAVLPLALLVVFVAFFLGKDTLLIGKSPPLIENIAIESITFHPNEIVVHTRNAGPDEVSIAQVAVNDLLMAFEVEPSPTLPRLAQAKVVIPTMWDEGDPYEIKLITSNGFVFTREVEIATMTPTPTVFYLTQFGLLGLYVGVIPVVLGLLWFPVLHHMNDRWLMFFLSFTAGLLIFLGVDAIDEAFDVAERVPDVFKSTALIVMGIGGSFFALVALRNRTKRGADTDSFSVRLTLSYFIAIGIGLHNLGEGLAIGAAYVLGEVALGAFLVVGFALHNVTEGLAIVTPVARAKPSFVHFALFALVAGVPTIFGTWIGGFTYSDLLAMIFLSIGAGAIFQVVYEIVKLISMESREGIGQLGNFIGVLVGLVVMYVTGLLVAI